MKTYGRVAQSAGREAADARQEPRHQERSLLKREDAGRLAQPRPPFVAAALALLLALPAQAQEVRDGYLRLADDTTVQVTGGVYLPSAKAQERARELVSLKAENERLRAAPVATPTAVVVALAIGITVGLGGAAALAVAVK